MSESRLVNVFITSKDKKNEKENTYDCFFKIPNSLIHPKPDEGLRLNIVSVYVPSTFQAIKDNCSFDVLIKDETNNELVERITFNIKTGSPYSMLGILTFISHIFKPVTFGLHYLIKIFHIIKRKYG